MEDKAGIVFTHYFYHDVLKLIQPLVINSAKIKLDFFIDKMYWFWTI